MKISPFFHNLAINHFSLKFLSYPTRAHGIIVKYSSAGVYTEKIQVARLPVFGIPLASSPVGTRI